MKLYSTKNPGHFVSLQQAVLKALPEDNGLYMPAEISHLPDNFIQNLDSFSFQEIAFEVGKSLIQQEIPASQLKEIVEKALDFPAPLVKLSQNTHILELFHGPSLAFKDFGARFMAQLMGFFNRNEDTELIILVATSGDTGGAVAAGFLHTPGIRVVILYPSGKVSDLQEKQLTTLGGNISALEINGTFDDCQALVKTAFLDKELNKHLRLSSANSINIGRLIPQSFYYFEAFKQLDDYQNPVVFSVPSGNFGNLTAGLFAWKMGLPLAHFIAATNINDIVPQYLKTAIFQPRRSKATLSNAMDVGNPSNFYRLLELFQSGSDERSTWNHLNQVVSGYSFSDTATLNTIKKVYNRYQYILDPHASVGFLAFAAYLNANPSARGIILETAHPSKFMDIIEPSIAQSVEIPERLTVLQKRTKCATFLEPKFELLRSYLLDNYS